jgi:hypothetical protein
LYLYVRYTAGKGDGGGALNHGFFIREAVWRQIMNLAESYLIFIAKGWIQSRNAAWFSLTIWPQVLHFLKQENC